MLVVVAAGRSESLLVVVATVGRSGAVQDCRVLFEPVDFVELQAEGDSVGLGGPHPPLRPTDHTLLVCEGGSRRNHGPLWDHSLEPLVPGCSPTFRRLQAVWVLGRASVRPQLSGERSLSLPEAPDCCWLMLSKT